MTSSTTTIKAVTDGNGTPARPAPRRQDLAALRDHEAKTLIALVCEANRTTSAVAHDMFDAIYDRDSNQSSAAQLQDQLCEALTCLETTDHTTCGCSAASSTSAPRPGPPPSRTATRRTRASRRSRCSAGLEDGNSPARPATQTDPNSPESERGTWRVSRYQRGAGPPSTADRAHAQRPVQ